MAAAIVTFTVQVGLRLRDYYKYETMTDVEQMYQPLITFPAVTICNQNAYRYLLYNYCLYFAQYIEFILENRSLSYVLLLRITEVKRWNIYDFIDEFYQDSGSVGKRVSTPHHEQIYKSNSLLKLNAKRTNCILNLNILLYNIYAVFRPI